MNIEIKLLKPEAIVQFKELITVFEIAFEMQDFQLPDDRHLQRLLNKETFIAVVATKDDKVIGGLTIYVIDQYYSTKPLAYIYDLAVLPDFRRTGVAGNLLAFTNNFCSEHGFEEVYVQAEKVDEDAIAFYRSTSPTEEQQVAHFFYTLNEPNDK